VPEAFFHTPFANARSFASKASHKPEHIRAEERVVEISRVTNGEQLTASRKTAGHVQKNATRTTARILDISFRKCGTDKATWRLAK